MKKTKITITLDGRALERVDRLVARRAFASRGDLVRRAVEELLRRRERVRLAAECAKLDRGLEKAMAEEGFAAVGEVWPEY